MDMLDQYRGFFQYTQQFEHFIFATMLAGSRLFACFAILQATSAQALQGRVRSGIVILIALYVAAGLPENIFAGLSGINLFILALKEAFLGMLLGFMAATVFWVAEGVGAMIDNVAGYNNVQQQNPLSSQQSTPISLLLLQLCITVFYMLGGFLLLLEALFATYRWWPISSMTPVPAAMLEQFVIFQTDTMMTQIVKIAAPALMVMVLIDLSFGLIAKTAGKLEPNSLAQPVKSATALLVVMLSLGVFIQQLTLSLSLSDLKEQLQGWVNLVGRLQSLQ
ncbi:MAG: type III secretion system export apparatus subunit SctT [Pseudomonadota bacterium]